jgi:hypothetical protein
MRSHILIIISFILCTVFSVLADHPSSIGDPNKKVEISFEFPDGAIKKGTFSYYDIQSILNQKPLSKSVYVDNYKIDWWIYGALQYFDLHFEVRTTGKTGYWESTITEIGNYSNGKKGKWVYSVNDILSKYHISTQTDKGIKKIQFIYKILN